MQILSTAALRQPLLSEEFHLSTLPQFLRLYDLRPLRDNKGGMQLNHSYACFCILKLLKPSVIIESGVWKGASTWLLQSVLPNAKLYCLDPVLSNIQYKSPTAEYRSTDFLDCDWTNIDAMSTLCIFDDHQSALHRCLHMKWWGLKYALFEDNYSPHEGDFYSIQQILAGTGHPQIQLTRNEYHALPLHSRFMRWLEQYALDKLFLRRFYSAQSIVRHPNEVDRIGFDNNIAFSFKLPCLVYLSDLHPASAPQPPSDSLYSRFDGIKTILDRYLSCHPEMSSSARLYYNNITFLSLK